jgi:hypothetical protein
MGTRRSKPAAGRHRRRGAEAAPGCVGQQPDHQSRSTSLRSLDRASNELKTMEDRRDAERIELKAATQKLMEERDKFENFHRRVAELVRQLVAQTAKSRATLGLTQSR